MFYYRGSEIENLKAEARRVLEELQKGRFKYDCGENLKEYICPEYHMLKQRYRMAMSRLREIDPTYPKDLEKESAKKQ